MARTSVSLSSFGYIAGSGGGIQIVGSGVLVNKICKITGGDVVRDRAGRLFYIQGILKSYSEIDGFLK